MYKRQDEVPELDKNKKHTVNVVIDRIIIKDGIRSRSVSYTHL